jgi:hypothetical protein
MWLEVKGLQRHFRRLTQPIPQEIKEEDWEEIMRSEGRLSPQRPQRLRTEKRVTSTTFLIHSKPAKEDAQDQQPPKKQKPILPPGSV